MIVFLLLLLLVCGPLEAQTVLELIEEGRLTEARQQVEGIDSLAPYQDYLAALFEVDAVQACSLYQLVSYRYPGTDVDRLAQERLLAFQQWGQSLPPFIAPGRSKPAELERPAAVTPSPEELPPAEPQPETAAPTQPPEPAPLKVAEVGKPESLKVQPGSTAVLEQAQPITRPLGFKAEEPEPPEQPQEETVAPPAAEAPPAPEPSVRPITEPPTAPHDIGPAEGGHIWVQVGAFGSRENADRLAGKLRQAGLPVTIVSKQSPKTLLHQVRVGGYPTREAARAVGEELQRTFRLSYFLIEL